MAGEASGQLLGLSQDWLAYQDDQQKRAHSLWEQMREQKLLDLAQQKQDTEEAQNDPEKNPELKARIQHLQDQGEYYRSQSRVHDFLAKEADEAKKRAATGQAINTGEKLGDVGGAPFGMAFAQLKQLDPATYATMRDAVAASQNANRPTPIGQDMPIGPAPHQPNFDLSGPAQGMMQTAAALPGGLPPGVGVLQNGPQATPQMAGGMALAQPAMDSGMVSPEQVEGQQTPGFLAKQKAEQDRVKHWSDLTTFSQRKFDSDQTYKQLKQQYVEGRDRVRDTLNQAKLKLETARNDMAAHRITETDANSEFNRSKSVILPIWTQTNALNNKLDGEETAYRTQLQGAIKAAAMPDPDPTGILNPGAHNAWLKLQDRREFFKGRLKELYATPQWQGIKGAGSADEDPDTGNLSPYVATEPGDFQKTNDLMNGLKGVAARKAAQPTWPTTPGVTLPPAPMTGVAPNMKGLTNKQLWDIIGKKVK